MAEMTPREIGAYHADLALQDFAQRQAEAAADALQRADTPEGKEYLTGKMERLAKWQATAQQQVENRK